MKTEDKKQIVKDLHEKLLASKIVILTDYKGLDVAEMNDLRNKLREANIEYKVVKNSLLIRAARGTGVELIEDSFKGPSAIALSYDDLILPAKVLTEYNSSNETLEIKAGVIDNKVLDFDAIKKLAKLPSHEVLIAQLLSSMIAIPTGMVRALNDIPRRFVNVLQAIKEQKEAA